MSPISFAASGPMVIPVGVTYQGPTDVVGAAPVAYWGMRGHSVAYSTGANAGVVVTGPTTLHILSDGTLDVASLSGGNQNIVTFTDQIGGYPLTVVAGSPNCVSSAGGLTGLTNPKAACANFTGTGSLGNASVLTSQGTPFTVAMVVRANTGAQGTIWANNAAEGGTGGGFFMGNFATTANQLQAYDGSTFNGPSIVNNAWFSAVCVFGGSGANASSMLINGTSSTGTLAGVTFGGPAPDFALGNSVGGFLTGNICELGIWNGAMGGTAQTNLQANHRTFWGF